MRLTRLKEFIQRWAINTLAVLVAAQVIRQGIQYERPVDLIVASLMLGLLNAFVRPVLMLLSFPLLIVTLGLFTFVINALLLYVVGWLLPGFYVSSFGAAFWGALVISLVSMAVNLLLGSRPARVEFRRNDLRRPPASRRPPEKDEGPVIDV